MNKLRNITVVNEFNLELVFFYVESCLWKTEFTTGLAIVSQFQKTKRLLGKI